MSLDVMIVGLGNIGFRHFQSLYKDKVFKKIILVEKDKKIISKIKKFYNYKKIYFFRKIPSFIKKIDWLILSTCSKNSYFVFKEVVSKIKIKNILFEKLISYENYKINEIYNILKKKKINGYLNLPRVTFHFYKKLKKIIKNNPIDYYVSGETSLASNLIHQLDIFLFLSSSKKLTLLKSSIDDKIFKSKRLGYSEFSGFLEFKTENGSRFVINDRKKAVDDFSDFIRIESKCYIINIIESKNLMTIINKKNNKLKFVKIKFPLQSEITCKIIKNIKKMKVCNFEKSKYYHFIIIKLFNNFLKKFNKNLKHYPVT